MAAGKRFTWHPPFQNADNPNETSVLYQWEHNPARNFLTSEEVRQAMKEAGVVDRDFFYLNEVEKLAF